MQDGLFCLFSDVWVGLNQLCLEFFILIIKEYLGISAPCWNIHIKTLEKANQSLCSQYLNVLNTNLSLVLSNHVYYMKVILFSVIIKIY